MATKSNGKANETPVTVNVKGIDVTVDKEVMNDIEVVELLGEVQDGNIFAFPKPVSYTHLTLPTNREV